ncbi:tonsoku-like protein [Armigeres subalbatus]|uniref:tonsoku-like protein n=1 Tax=Armigeres subalbatus TaxID=124917 RepID=UPI002ED08CE3
MSDNLDLEEQRLLRRKKKSSEAGNLQQLAETCRKLGDLYCDRGEHLKALNEYKLVAKAFHNLKMPMDVGRANRLVGEMFMLLDEFEKALQYEKVYLDIARNENDKVELQRAYVTIGRTYLLKGQGSDDPVVSKESLSEAERSFVKGLKLCRELKEVGKLEQSDMEARAILNLGVTKEHQGELNEAVEYMEKATKIAQSNDILDLVHLCLMATAQLFSGKLNNSAKALKLLNEALEVASRLSNKTAKMCETLSAKADAIIKLGDFQSAKKALKTAYNMRSPVAADAENIERNLKILVAIKRVEDELIIVDSMDFAKKKLLNETLGDASCKLYNYGKAIDYYLKMLDCAERNGESGRQLVPIYVSLYQTYKDNKQYKEALQFLWKEYDLIQDEPKEAYNTLLSISEIYEMQKRSCFEIEDMYRRVRLEAQKLQSLSLQRAPLKRCVAMLKKNDMDLMAENLEKEAADLGIDLTLADDANLTDDSDDEHDESTIDTPDIGNDVNLDELSDSDEDQPRSNNQAEKQTDSRSTRRRGLSFQIKRNNKGETQLHQACINGNKLLVQKLLEQGHPVNLRDHAGWLPLHEACNKGEKDIVEMLLDKGAHINDKGGTSCDGITPLYDACSNGNLEVIELLLDRGANCLLRTDSGDTTLNVLEIWFESVRKKLPSESIVFYNAIRDRIVSCFDKVGIKPTSGRTIPDSIEMNIETTRSTRRQPNRVIRPDSDSEILSVPSQSTSKTPIRKRPPKNRLDSSDEEQENGQGRSFRERATRRQNDVVDDYRSTIQVLRKGNTVRAQIVSPLKDPNPGPSKRGAFLRNDEIGDDWLIDDLGPSKKRQKFHSEKDYVETSKRTPKRNNNRESSPPAQTPPVSARAAVSAVLDFDSEEPELVSMPPVARNGRSSSEEKEPDAYQILMNASGRSFSRKRSSQSKLSRRSSTGSNSNQISLLEAGFEKSNRSVTPPLEMVVSRGSIEQAAPETPSKCTPTNIIRVLVESEPIDVSYDPEQLSKLSVDWLVQQVTKRFVIKNGKKPILKLLRSNEDLCQDTDPLTSLLSAFDSTVNAYLIGFESLKADEFYADCCEEANLDPIFDLLETLKYMNINGRFAVRGDIFEGQTPQWDILFRALSTDDRLQDLNLSHNKITDTMLVDLGRRLPNINHLMTLNLSLNAITYNGLYFLQALNDQSRLTELDLSRNPLQDSCLSVLSPLTRQLKQLKILRLVSTAIRNLTFSTPPVDIANLHVFDVSENKLNKSSIEFLLTKLNTRITTELNLRALGLLPDFTPALIVVFKTNNFDMLQSLDLQCCDLTDSDLSAIMCSLQSTADKLRSLNASFNHRLTKEGLIAIFKNFTRRSLVVKLRQNPSILKDFDAEQMLSAIEHNPDNFYPTQLELMLPLRITEEKLEVLRQQLRVFWEKLWHDRSIIIVGKNTIELSTRSDSLL